MTFLLNEKYDNQLNKPWQRIDHPRENRRPAMFKNRLQKWIIFKLNICDCHKKPNRITANNTNSIGNSNRLDVCWGKEKQNPVKGLFQKSVELRASRILLSIQPSLSTKLQLMKRNKYLWQWITFCLALYQYSFPPIQICWSDRWIYGCKIKVNTKSLSIQKQVKRKSIHPVLHLAVSAGGSLHDFSSRQPSSWLKIVVRLKSSHFFHPHLLL